MSATPHYLPDLGQFRVVGLHPDQVISLTLERAREIAAEWREDAERNAGSPYWSDHYSAMARDADAAADRVEAQARKYPATAAHHGVRLLAEAA